MKGRHCALLLGVALGGCSPQREPIPLTPGGEAAGSAVVRRAQPDVPSLPAPGASLAPVVPAPAPPVDVPPDAVYVCVTETGGARQQVTIEFAPKVGAMCAKNPEMGPCRYERDVCRRAGGRVYAAGGVEITAKIEAEYDRKVMRVRFKAD